MKRSRYPLVLLVALDLGLGCASALAAAPFYEQGLRLEEAGRWEEAYQAYLQSVENREQAWARANVGSVNMGGRAARACLDMIDLKRKFRLYPR